MLINIMDFLEKKDDLSKTLQGEVVVNEDPKKKNRIKVVIPNLIDDISENYDKLPWVYPSANFDLSGKGVSQNVPEIGAIVCIETLENLPYFLIYTKILTNDKNNPQLLYPDNFSSKEKGWQYSDNIYELYNFENKVYKKKLGDYNEEINNGNLKLKVLTGKIGNISNVKKVSDFNVGRKLDNLSNAINSVFTGLKGIVDPLTGGALSALLAGTWDTPYNTPDNIKNASQDKTSDIELS